MAFYKLDYENISESIRENLEDDEFVIEKGWLYARELPESVVKLFNITSTLAVLHNISSIPEKRKKALKCYQRERISIDSIVDGVNKEEYPWFITEKSSIYDKDEQLLIKKLVLFLVEGSKEHSQKANQIMNQLFPFVKGQSYASRKVIRESKRIVGDNYINDLNENFSDVEDKASRLKAIEKGMLVPFENFESESVTYTKNLHFNVLYFYNSFVEEMKGMNYLFIKELTYTSYIDWAIRFNQDYLLEHYSIIAREAEYEAFDDVIFDTNSSVKEELLDFEISRFKLPLSKKTSLIDIIDSFNIEILNLEHEIVENHLQRHVEQLEEQGKKIEFLKSPVFASPLEEVKKVINTDFFDVKMSKSTINFLDSLREFRFKVLGAYDHVLAEYFNRGGKEAELLHTPIEDHIWEKALPALYDFEFLIGRYEDEEKDPKYETELTPYQKLVEGEIAYLFRVVIELLLLDEEENKRKATIKKVSKKKGVSKEKLLEEQINKLKNEISKKEDSVKRLSLENQALSEKVKKLSRDNSRVESLDRKLGAANEKVEKLEKELEEQQPIVIDRSIQKEEVSTKKVLELLNSEEQFVTMVGGHQALMTKVKQWAPNMEHIESRDYIKEISIKTTILIMNVSYINHPMFYKSMARLEQIKKNHDIQLVYLNTQSTNKDVLLKEIGRQLTI